MKKIYLNLFSIIRLLLTFFILTFVIQNSFAWGWSVRDAERQPTESPAFFLGDQVSFAWDVDATGWGASFKKAGIGTANTTSGMNWQNIIWVDDAGDGNGNHEGFRSAVFTLNSVESWYYSLWIGWGASVGDNGRWYNGNSSYNEGSSTFQSSTFTVSAINNPSTQTATRNSSNPAISVELTWDKDAQSHNVMIVRKLSTQSWTEPTQNTPYSANALIGDGVVVYNGSSISYTNTSLETGQIYDYKFYSENNQYYSAGVTAQVTTGSAATDYFRSLGTGNWNSSNSWQSSMNGTSWINATQYPASTANTVDILSTHTVTVTSAETAKNLTINTAGGILIINPTNSLTVAGTLTNSAGNSGLIIKSDINGTGSLIHNTANVPATVERYITGSSNLELMRYHFVSVPLVVENASTSNLFLNSYLFNFTESTGAWNALGSGTSTVLDETRGYMIYYPGENTTYTFAGQLNNGTFTALSSYTSGQGYNLVPNPYPSAIDWNAGSGWTKTNIAGTLYYWPAGAVASSANYASWNGAAGVNNGTRYVPVGQAFFVQATGSLPELKMTNATRVHNAQAFWKDSELIPDLLRIKTVALHNNSYDEVVVHFREGATANFDSDFDANKLQGGEDAPQFSSVAMDNSRLSINSLPFTTGDAIVPLDFSLNAATDVTFTATGMESFYEGIPIYLEDHLLNKVVDLRTDPVYTFSHTAGSAGNRFLIRFMGVTGTPEHTTTEGSAFVSNGHLYVDVPSMSRSEATISIYDMLGRQFSSRKIMLSGITELPAPAASGVYVVKILAGNKSFERKIVVNL